MQCTLPLQIMCIIIFENIKFKIAKLHFLDQFFLSELLDFSTGSLCLDPNHSSSPLPANLVISIIIVGLDSLH